MRVLDMITTAGGAGRNDDRAGHRGSLAWAIDGTTDLYRDAALPAESDVQWLVHLVDSLLAEAGVVGYQGSGAALLAEVAALVCERQAEYGFPADRLPPACSVIVAVDQGPRHDITRIGDATGVVTGELETVLATGFFDHRERSAVADAQGNACSAEQVRAGMSQRRLHTMTEGEVESVFSGHPRRRLRPHTTGGPWNGVDHVLLCTDGFARVVTDYQIYPQWRDVVSTAATHGLAYLEKVIREFERGPGASQQRFKRSDDIAALLLTPGGSS